MTMKTFRLSDEEWTESTGLTLLPAADRDAWWGKLGEALGFDPGTVDWVRPRVFNAEPTRKPVPAAPSGRETASERAIDVPVERREPRGTRPPSAPEQRVAATVVSTEGKTLVRLDQVGCARCGADAHYGITYLRLTRPVVLGAETFTHWAWCPSTGEPILLQVVDGGEDVRMPGDLERLLGGPDPLADDPDAPKGKKKR